MGGGGQVGGCGGVWVGLTRPFSPVICKSHEL